MLSYGNVRWMNYRSIVNLACAGRYQEPWELLGTRDFARRKKRQPMETKAMMVVSSPSFLFAMGERSRRKAVLTAYD